MIRSFKCKETEKVWAGFFSSKLPSNIQAKALIKLMQLNQSKSIEDLRLPPSNRLEKLVGDRKEQYSIRINQKWRICFVWHNDNAFNVEIVDYH